MGVINGTLVTEQLSNSPAFWLGQSPVAVRTCVELEKVVSILSNDGAERCMEKA